MRIGRCGSSPMAIPVAAPVVREPHFALMRLSFPRGSSHWKPFHRCTYGDIEIGCEELEPLETRNVEFHCVVLRSGPAAAPAPLLRRAPTKQVEVFDFRNSYFR